MKKIIQADEEVGKVAQVTPVVICKKGSCFFILRITCLVLGYS